MVAGSICLTVCPSVDAAASLPNDTTSCIAIGLAGRLLWAVATHPVTVCGYGACTTVRVHCGTACVAREDWHIGTCVGVTRERAHGGLTDLAGRETTGCHWEVIGHAGSKCGACHTPQVLPATTADCPCVATTVRGKEAASSMLAFRYREPSTRIRLGLGISGC